MKKLQDAFLEVPKFCDKWDGYFAVYETWLSKFIGKEPRILEIGIQHGGSSQMWLEYFGPGTKIVGVDIDSRCVQHTTDDIQIEIGDQGNPGFWESIFEKYPEPFDIVIDDGGHVMPEMIISFVSIINHVKDQGVYLMEDVCTAYWTDINLLREQYVDACGLYNPKSVVEFAKKAVDVINAEHMEAYPQVPQLPVKLKALFNRITGLHFYNSMIVFEVGQRQNLQRVNNSGITMMGYK